MRKLQKELLNKKMSLHQALMSMDVLNPDYDKLKREVNRLTTYTIDICRVVAILDTGI